MSHLLRVLFAEDHCEMREAIALLLSERCEVAGVVDRGDEVLAAAQQLQPDAVVLDVSLPGISGLQLIPELRGAFPGLGIVMLSNHSEPVYISEAQLRGADAYVLKNYASEQLWPALQDAFLKRSPPKGEHVGQERLRDQ